MAQKFVVGVDGGGTKTSTACVNVFTKEVVGTGLSGSTNWNSVGTEKAKEHLFESIQQSLTNGGVSWNQVVGISLGMSGVDRPNDKILVNSMLSELVQKELGSSHAVQFEINNDAVIALASGTQGSLHGVVVISGTGMIAYGFNHEKEKRAGGWGPLFGDEGSGHGIGSSILKAIAYAVDGRGPSTILVDRVLSQVGETNPMNLIPWAYNEKDQSWKKIADLAPIAFSCAQEGDQVANQLIQYAADELLKTITAVANYLSFEGSFPVVFAGGNLTHENSMLANLLKQKVKSALPNAVVTFPTVTPAAAAALLVAKKYN